MARLSEESAELIARACYPGAVIEVERHIAQLEATIVRLREVALDALLDVGDTQEEAEARIAAALKEQDAPNQAE